MVRMVLSWVGVAVVVYVVLFVPVGDRTLWQHAVRIAGTDEAQELKDEAVDAAERLQDHVEQQLDEHVRDGGTDADAGDGGDSETT